MCIGAIMRQIFYAVFIKLKLVDSTALQRLPPTLKCSSGSFSLYKLWGGMGDAKAMGDEILKASKKYHVNASTIENMACKLGCKDIRWAGHVNE